VVALVAGGVPAFAQDVSGDPAVTQARERLTEARGRLTSLSSGLDAAAAAFERAQAHHLRLLEEDRAAETSVASAEEAVAASRAAFGARVSEAYMRPETDLALAEAVLLAPDAATAVHRAALMERLTARSGLRLEQAQQASGQVRDGVDQRRIIASGVATAAQEQKRAADALAVQVSRAEAAVADGEHTLTEAERDAHRRAEERARAEAAEAAARAAAAQAAVLVSAASPPVPRLDGKVCPIGAPNGFIDSWGFPRSGGRQHQGVDMFAAYGMPLYAVADGFIQRVWNNRLGGLSINLVDDQGDRYYYAHLSAVSVSEGQRVRAGAVIGANGNSGNARTTPPHLHWQYHPGNGPPVNPYPLAAALCR
jgi:peptidoglycan LD-endopeptidase LytH